MLVLALVAPQAPIALRPGMVIAHSCRVKGGTYNFPMPQGEASAGDERIPTFTPAIVIRGNHIVVDFAGATLRGTPQTALPDQRKGLGIEIDGNDITVKNVHVNGYKVGLIARNCRGLKVLNSDFSYNWKQHLHSTLEREDLSDWQSYHHNEHDEWLRYGAGMYLSDCDAFQVAGTRVTGGQCGLMLNRCGHGHVFGNNFSFLSGVGLGLYRSSFNLVDWNRIDWCVRGFSYGVYNRGQDSAGILIFEQSSSNTFFYNSVTHGGDGFFLWAGQQTMDTGRGGCNDNLLRNNDFSHSPANGIEATFSRNRFQNNLLLECWHGIWGGYSYSTDIWGNVFGLDGQGIAIEHGQNNLIRDNRFSDMSQAIDLWADPNNDPNFGYRKRGDLDSHGYSISENEFDNVSQFAVHLRNTRDVAIDDNVATRNAGVWTGDRGKFLTSKSGLAALGISIGAGQQGVRPMTREDNSATLSQTGNTSPSARLNPDGQPVSAYGLPRESYIRQFDLPWDPTANPPIKGAPKSWPAGPQPWSNESDGIKAKTPFLTENALRGQRYILVDEWGPYDFRRPILWPREILAKTPALERRRFEILGPPGRWRVVGTRGVARLSKESGRVPDDLDAEIDVSHPGEARIELAYVGAATTDYRGMVTPAGRPVRFAYTKFRLPIRWDVSFYRWSVSENPADPHAAPRGFSAVLRTTPIKRLATDNLDYAGGALVPGLPDNHYGTLATGTFTAPAGDYTFEMTTDDGARLWLDGRPLIIDAWHYQGPTLYSKTAHLAAGQHALRVEHFQIDGYAALKVVVRPR